MGILAALGLLTDLSFSFALYGALHASALVLALRMRQPFWRGCVFIIAAAGLSFLTLRVGLAGMRLFGAVPGNGAFYAAVGVSAALGAAAYGILVRLLGLCALTVISILVIAAGCVLATYGAVFALTHFHSLGRWWLAVFWWYAFSGGLWYQGLSGDRTCSGRTPTPRI